MPFDQVGGAPSHEPRALAEPNNREHQAARTTRTRPVRRSWLAIAASVLIVALGAAAWWQSARYPLYSTDTGERRSITLADGSTVTITRGAGDAIISVTTAATTSSTPPATTTSTVYITA